MEVAVDIFCDVSNVKGHRVQMGCRSVRDDGDVVSSDSLHAANDAWWQVKIDVGISCSTRACHSTVLDSVRELGLRGESHGDGTTESASLLNTCPV